MQRMNKKITWMTQPASTQHEPEPELCQLPLLPMTHDHHFYVRRPTQNIYHLLDWLHANHEDDASDDPKSLAYALDELDSL
jgi:hypothetical protein